MVLFVRAYVEGECDQRDVDVTSLCLYRESRIFYRLAIPAAVPCSTCCASYPHPGRVGGSTSQDGRPARESRRAQGRGVRSVRQLFIVASIPHPFCMCPLRASPMLVLRAVSLRDGGGTAVHYSVVTHGPHLQCAHASGSSTARTYSHVPALLLETLSSNPVGLKTASISYSKFYISAPLPWHLLKITECE